MKLRGWFGIIAACTLRVTPLLAQPVSVPSPERYVLQNGLTVVLAPDSAASAVNVAVGYSVGQVSDREGYRGLAHLLEHLTFRGSRHLKPLEADKIFSELGVGYNASTGLEHTVYFSALPARALETVLWVESERMAFALDGIDAVALKAEQRVVVNELAERRRTLSRMLWANRQAILYGPNHPMGTSEDEASDVEAVDLPAVQWFYQRTHRPDNATLVITGKFDAQAAHRWVEKYFSTLENPPGPRLIVKASAPRLCGVRSVTLGHPFLLGRYLEVTWALPGNVSPEEVVSLEVATNILSDRLRRVLQRQSYMASDTGVAVAHFQTHGLLSVRVQLQETAQWTQVEQAIDTETMRLAQVPLSDVELRNVRRRRASRSLRERESGLAGAIQFAKGFDPSVDRQLEQSVSADTVRRAARVFASASLRLRAQPARSAHENAIILADESRCP